jgi:NTP pyrophosphatase (non-canonical NTP hydrolase)
MHISDFQNMMEKLYFKKDKIRGINGTLIWLEEEVEELRDALEKGDSEATQKEFADVFAWLASLANMVSIDLEKAALSKYNNKCPKCQNLPCDCKE